MKAESIGLAVAAVFLPLLVAAVMLNRRAPANGLYGIFESETLILAAILLP